MINENPNFVSEMQDILIGKFREEEYEIQRGVVGLTLDEARKKFKKKMFRVGFIYSYDFRRNRVNVEMQGDRIAKVISLG
jgi:hypothetical protein